MSHRDLYRSPEVGRYAQRRTRPDLAEEDLQPGRQPTPRPRRRCATALSGPVASAPSGFGTLPHHLGETIAFFHRKNHHRLCTTQTPSRRNRNVRVVASHTPDPWIEMGNTTLIESTGRQGARRVGFPGWRVSTQSGITYPRPRSASFRST